MLMSLSGFWLSRNSNCAQTEADIMSLTTPETKIIRSISMRE